MELENRQDQYTIKTNICIDCKKACGGCSWSAYDKDTKKLKFEPVPGWTAEPCYVKTRSGDKNLRIKTMHITACPLFEPDDRRGYNEEEDYD